MDDNTVITEIEFSQCLTAEARQFTALFPQPQSQALLGSTCSKILGNETTLLALSVSPKCILRCLFKYWYTLYCIPILLNENPFSQFRFLAQR